VRATRSGQRRRPPLHEITRAGSFRYRAAPSSRLRGRHQSESAQGCESDRNPDPAEACSSRIEFAGISQNLEERDPRRIGTPLNCQKLALSPTVVIELQGVTFGRRFTDADVSTTGWNLRRAATLYDEPRKFPGAICLAAFVGCGSETGAFIILSRASAQPPVRCILSKSPCRSPVP